MKADHDQTEGTDARFQLVLMRHGIAAAAGTPAYPDDAGRPLTPEGRRKMKEAGKGLVKLRLEIDWIVTSPLLRAAETAQIVAESFPVSPPLDTLESLGSGGPLESLTAFLQKRPERRRPLIVGHEPQLSDFAARLIGAGRNANLAFKKGGCCLIRFEGSPEASRGTLMWWLTPSLLRSLR